MLYALGTAVGAKGHDQGTPTDTRPEGQKMPIKRREAHTPAAVVSDCRHHWMIESSQQNESKGCCQLCGEVRTFQNKVSFPSKKPAEVVIEGVPIPDDPLSPESDDSSSLKI
jgi:hypothetical protein